MDDEETSAARPPYVWKAWKIGGLVLASIRSNGTFVLTSYGMGPKAEGILALEEKVAELKTLFLRANQRPYDGRPEIGIVTDPGANDEERGDRG